MTDITFPLPNKWSTRPVVTPLLFGLSLLGVGLWWLVAACMSATDGDTLRSIFLFVASATLFSMAGMIYVSDATYRQSRMTHARITLEPDGICILPATRQRLAQAAFFGTFVVTGLIFSIGTWTRTLDIPISPGFATFYPPFMLAAVVLASTMMARTWMRRNSLGQLRLGARTLYYEAGRADEELPWSQVQGMSINSPRIGRSSSAGCVIHLHPTTGPRPIEIATNMLSTGCAPTYWLVKYYVEHPEDREELGDQRAIDRLMSGRVVTNRKNHL